MNAEQMFEELGYKLQKRMNVKLCYACYNVEVNFHWDNDVTLNGSYSMKLHNAIHQQMKELGWLDE